MLVAPALEGKSGDKANQFLWTTLSEMCLYAARRVPEIADSIVDVDHAMHWGFAWELGPFEIWDAIGVERMAKALEREGKKLPPLGGRSAGHAAEIVLRNEKGTRRVTSTSCERTHKPLPEAPGIIILKSLKDRTPVVQENSGREPDRLRATACCAANSTPR